MILIIGGGISGLSLAYFLTKAGVKDLIVIEEDKRLGGKIRTEKEDGWLLETGVNAFLNNKPKTLELAKSLSLEPLRSSDSARKRFICFDGKLHLLPESPIKFFTSSLMTLSGKLRIVCEPFIKKGIYDDETLAGFARRRLGKDAYEKLIDPMAGGIYAGDPEIMSLKSSFPRIYELEQTYGSLIKALIKLQKEAKSSGREKIGPAPRGVLTSFYEGMEVMINALKETLRNKIKTDFRVISLEKIKEGYRVHLSDGSELSSEKVVFAIPSYELASIVKETDSSISDIFEGIPYPPLSVIALGYKKDKIHTSINAFGFLVPKIEGRKILGCLYDSSIFPNRAPEGYVLLRCMVGGAKSPHIALLNDNKLLSAVLKDIKDIIGIRKEPDFIRVFRHEKAIPQYLVGHSERLKKIDELLLKYKGLYITGNAFRGIGFNDCIENSYKLAEMILKDK